MDPIKSYRNNTLVKCIVIPLIVTLLTLVMFHFALPYIESRLPDASEYYQTVDTEVDDYE